LLDIIIVNYNSTDYLLHCLESIFNDLREIPAKVFVQDNASRDDIDRINAIFPQVDVSRNSYNMGFARAINNALRRSAARYVLILNPDTVIVRGFFKAMIDFMENNPDVGVTGPKIRNHDGSIQASARSFPSPFTAFFGRSSFMSKWFPSNRLTIQNLLTTRSDGQNPMEVDWVSGACMLVRKEAIRKVGLMDENFFMYWEDADWCKRMRENGWKVTYFPGVSIIHYVGISSEKAIWRSTIEFHKSCYKLFKKHSSPFLRLLSPLAIAGLSIRIFLVLSTNMIRIWSTRQGALFELRNQVHSGANDKKIKILRMIARLNVGGPAIHVHLLTKGIDPDRFQSLLVTGKISPQEGDMSYLFDSLDKKPIIIPELQREISLMLDLKALIRIFKILRREKPDVIHTHTAKAGTSARLAAMTYNLVSDKKVKLVHTFHGHVFEGYFSRKKSLMFIWIERLLARGTDVIIAISETQKTALADKHRIAPAEKIKIIPLGFDLESFLHCSALKGQFRKSLGLEDDVVLIGIIGRMVPIKHHKMFFKAARIFVEENPGIRVKFIVVGDGELRDDLETYCQKFGMAEKVHFCGWMKDLPPVYADLDILALTSMNEGTPVSIIESMAASVPVISTDVGGVRDLLGAEDGSPPSDGFKICERGILCQKNDAKGLANGLTYLTVNHTRENQELLTRARLFVEKKFSQKRLLNDIESLYLDLMGKQIPKSCN